MADVLVVDNQRAARNRIAKRLRCRGYCVDEADSGVAGCRQCARVDYDVVVVVDRSRTACGVDVVRSVKHSHPSTEVILMAADGAAERGLEALRCGAFDYAQRLLTEEQILFKVDQAVESRRRRTQLSLPVQAALRRGDTQAIGTRARAARQLAMVVASVAQSNAPVLITGERATDRLLVARAMHAASRRADRPFVVVDCAAPCAALCGDASLARLSGKFLGGSSVRQGALEQADGGTVFLDDIAHATLRFQGAVERALLAANATVPRAPHRRVIDVRVVASTRHNLAEAVRARRFDQALYGCLNATRVHVAWLGS